MGSSTHSPSCLTNAEITPLEKFNTMNSLDVSNPQPSGQSAARVSEEINPTSSQTVSNPQRARQFPNHNSEQSSSSKVPPPPAGPPPAPVYATHMHRLASTLETKISRLLEEMLTTNHLVTISPMHSRVIVWLLDLTITGSNSRNIASFHISDIDPCFVFIHKTPAISASASS